MRFAVNIEFTDEELRRYGEDVSRRVVLNGIHDVVRHLGAMKINPDLTAQIAQAVATSIFASKAPRRPAPPPNPPETPSPPPPSLEKCSRVEGHQYMEEGWVCHCCSTYNVALRSACRTCGHERCDVIVPPAPSPESESDADSSDVGPTAA